jgi:glucose-6-phosphate 1-dehydrogenase
MNDENTNVNHPEIIPEGHAEVEAASGTCILDRPPDPCTIVILGASGDLASRKLIPAFFNLFCMGGLPDPFRIVGCGRTQISDDAFRKKMETSIIESGHDPDCWEDFAKFLYYRTLIYDSRDSYSELKDFLQNLDSTSGTMGNRIFYLAIPMFLYGTTAELLGAGGLAHVAGNQNGWTRLVVEKPYGSDRQSAAKLDEVIHRSFAEEQIYRIDHYLAKETVQNILTLRFANAIFEPLWNRNYIEYVDIIASETLGVEKRAGYYDKSGVLRDMFQNHMLQLLALTAMEPPHQFQTSAVREEKIKVFNCLRPFPVDNLFENLVLGQYGHGVIDGDPVKGYREEEGVAPDSTTPTFGMMRAYIDNWRWKGVPFFLTSGKRLGAKLTQIAIKFREVPVTMFGDELGIPISANVLTFGIQPREHITLTFQTKTPGAKMCLRTVEMDFDYLQGYSGPSLAAYEKALLDCMNGDQMLFWHRDGVDLAWAFIEPILRRCDSCEDKDQLLNTYEPGSWGPPAALQLKELMEEQRK